MTTKPNPGHSIVMTMAIELIGIGLMAALAETGPNAGRAMVALMAGFMLIWFLTNVEYFSSIIGKMRKY